MNNDKNFKILIIGISVVLSILIMGTVINACMIDKKSKANDLKIIIDGKVYDSSLYEYLDDNIIIINERGE